MPHSFDIELTEDVEVAIERARQAAANAGSTFHGDRFAGHFVGNGVSGYYRVEGERVIISITDKPAVMPDAMIEAAVRRFFVTKDEATSADDDAARRVGSESTEDGGPTPAVLRRRAAELVKKHVLMAGGAGLIPIPMADMAAVTAVQVKMLVELTSLYGASYSQNALKEFVTALTGSAAARIGASALKAIPGFGSVVGGASMSIMSGASTYAVGHVTIDELEAGADLRTADRERMKKAYEEAFEEGKRVAETIEQDGDAAGGDVVDKLERLAALRRDGVLTEEEFERQKAALLRDG